MSDFLKKYIGRRLLSGIAGTVIGIHAGEAALADGTVTTAEVWLAALQVLPLCLFIVVETIRKILAAKWGIEIPGVDLAGSRKLLQDAVKATGPTN